MKKLALILAMLLVVPCAAFGLEMMNDTAMDDVTGQAGVSIAFDDVQLFINVDRIAWLDSDGFDAQVTAGGVTGEGGAVGLDGFQLDVLMVNALTGTQNGNTSDMTSIGQFDTQFDYGSTAPLGGPAMVVSAATSTAGLDNYTVVNSGQFRALSIDATSELPALTTGKQANLVQLGLTAAQAGTVNIGGVLIGIPTVEMYIPSMKMTPVFHNVVGEAVAFNATEISGMSYGTIVMEGITFTALSGWVEIAPH